MPAHIFELLCAFFYLMDKLGKPPSDGEIASLLDIRRCTVIQRRVKSVALGYIVEPPHSFRRGNWARFTDRGAEAFMAILDGIEPVTATDGMYCSLNRDFMPDGVGYSYVPFSQYREYMKALTAHGYADPA